MGKETIISRDIRQTIPERLPLLEYVNKKYLIEEKRLFTGYKLLAVQHLLGSTVPLLEMFERGGAKKEDIHIVGKAYSTHADVVTHLTERGYQIVGNPFDFIPKKPYSNILGDNIKLGFDAILNDPEFIMGSGRVLILEDGGEAVKILHRDYPDRVSRFVGVEQTSIGAHALHTMELGMPVINVARSEAKTRIESPIIAQSVVKEFHNLLTQYADIVQLRNNTVFVVGYGFIGEAVTMELEKNGYQVIVYDAATKMLEKAKADKKDVVTDLHEGFDRAGTIIGCSGYSSILLDEMTDIPPGTLLVSASSTDSEFSAWELRQRGKVVNKSDLPWRSLYKIGELYLANSGFPINFSGNIDPIPPQDIQLTRALLLGGALQAVGEQGNGLVNLDPQFQEQVVSEFFTLRGK